MPDLYHDLTEKIIGCFFEVYNTLGYGFLEKVYERAMMIELAEQGLAGHSQCPIRAFFKAQNIGDYCADIIVEDKIVLELKAAEAIAEEHEFQLVNYLRATDIEIGLLLNFGRKPEIRRKIFTNDRKALPQQKMEHR